MSWTFAKDLCEQMGGHLVVVNDANESAFLNSFIDSGSKDAYWIGASNFLGTAQNQDGIWKWVTGEDLNYMNWHSGEPSSSGLEGEREHWAEIRKSYSYQWNDVNNTSKKNKGFILEIDSVEPTQYAVEFKSNGGSGTMASQTIAEGDNLILPACTFTAPDGKKFKAWNIAGNEYAVGASYKVTGNTVVTAVWEEAARKTQIISVSKTASGTSVAIFCSDANATVFCASYDVSGKMTDIESKPVSLGQNTYNFSFTTANSVKAFVLDAGYRPLCESGSR